MNHFRSGALRPTEPQPTSLLGFLADPYLFTIAGLLGVMISLSIAISPIHTIGMRIRWPVLGLVAAISLCVIATRGLKKMTFAHGAMAMFLILATVSSLYSIDRRYSFERSVSIVMLFTVTMLGVYVYCQSMTNATKLTDLIWWIGAATVILGMLYRHGTMGPGGRYEGLHARATGAGSFAALFLPLAIYQVRYRLRDGWKLFGWFVTFLLIAQIVLAGARMAIITAGLVALGLWAAYYGKRAFIAAAILSVTLPAPFLLNPQRIAALQEKSDRIVRAESLTTFTGRLDRWVFGIEQFRDKPVLGHGLGASRTLAGREDPRRFDIKPGEVFNLHSDQIEVLMDLGAVGYLPFGLFWVAAMMTGIKLIGAPFGRARQLGLAYFGCTIYTFGDTFMHGGFLAAGGGVSAYSWTMLAAMMAMSKLCHVERRSAPLRQVAAAPPQIAPSTIRPARKIAPAGGLRLPSARRLANG